MPDHGALPKDAAPTGEAATRPPAWEWLLLTLLLLAYSFVQSPVPGVNEPHYLAKARAYWQSDWCARDFFLHSSNPHLVFYLTVGWATQFSMQATALVGRIIVLCLLAVSWTRLAFTLTGERGLGLVSAGGWLLLTTWVNFSGEWVVGGLEAKVFAYAATFAGLDFLARHRWKLSAIALGLATSFHPVVGCWVVLGVAPILVFSGFQLHKHKGWTSEFRRELIVSLALFACASAPGLIPALQLVAAESADPSIVRDADYVQVFHRLAHHLDPMRFPMHSYVTWGLLTIAFPLLIFQLPAHLRDSWAMRVWVVLIGSTVLVAVVGVLLGLGPRPALEMAGWAWRGKLLKFYPFRLVDALLPLAVVLAAVQLVTCRKPGTQGPRVWIVAGVVLFGGAIAIPASSRSPSRMDSAKWDSWREVCHWIRVETEPDDLVVTPRLGWGFKWYAERSEFYSPKDCPQESSGIMEWFYRGRDAKKWELGWKARGKIAVSDLSAIHDRTAAEWLICPVQLDAPPNPRFENEHFKVFALASDPVDAD